jgi:hypothetical protein
MTFIGEFIIPWIATLKNVTVLSIFRTFINPGTFSVRRG